MVVKPSSRSHRTLRHHSCFRNEQDLSEEQRMQVVGLQPENWGKLIGVYFNNANGALDLINFIVVNDTGIVLVENGQRIAIEFEGVSDVRLVPADEKIAVESV